MCERPGDSTQNCRNNREVGHVQGAWLAIKARNGQVLIPVLFVASLALGHMSKATYNFMARGGLQVPLFNAATVVFGILVGLLVVAGTPQMEALARYRPAVVACVMVVIGEICGCLALGIGLWVAQGSFSPENILHLCRLALFYGALGIFSSVFWGRSLGWLLPVVSVPLCFFLGVDGNGIPYPWNPVSAPITDWPATVLVATLLVVSHGYLVYKPWTVRGGN